MKTLYKVSIIFLSTIVLIFQAESIFATHNRAGEITVRQISDLTFEVKIVTFTYTLSAADRNELDVQWGDNTVSTADRDSIAFLPNNYRRSVYFAQHTYPGPGTYEIVVQDPNRNFGVLNIPNSVNVIFSIKTIITIDPDIGDNNTPVLLNPPIDMAARNQIFIHNPAAFDFDGDSISYELTVCTKENGEPIEDYAFPPELTPTDEDTIYVDPISGDLVWDTPIDTGIYNIAMNITEWRDGVRIGNIARDMQVEVYNTDNNPPVNDSLPDLCITAGTFLEYPIRSTDVDGDSLTHFITGGPFAYEDTLAYYETVSRSPGELVSLFSWQTACKHPRKQPYSIIVKTEDHNPELSLIDIDNLYVKVLGPAPATPEVRPSSMSTTVTWDKYVCENIQGYKIYRKEGSSDYSYDSCTPGLPPSSGFELIGQTRAHEDTLFFDNNNGTGLLQGTEYCYRITAILSDGSESFPSEENCTILVPGSPSMLNTSVTSLSENGSIFISWAKPEGLDTIPANGPYEYIIYRSEDLWGNDLEQVHSFTTSDLNDTTYTDNPVNTLDYPYSYSVELYNNEPGNRFLIGDAEVASTIFLNVQGGDNRNIIEINKNVPWLNTSYVIYLYNENTTEWDSIDITNEEVYIHNNLINNQEYCYQVRSQGIREVGEKSYFNENYSHTACGITGDEEPPCPPDLSVEVDCGNRGSGGHNTLNWSYRPEDEECSRDVVKYNIYYTPNQLTDFVILDSLKGRDQNTYTHYPELGLAACYYVTAVDSFGNESPEGSYTVICKDECIQYEIPNVFSPNGDGYNDILKPYEYQDVQQIDLKIFNRWGQMIYETEDPDINWDGKHQDTDDLVSPGVYYYICDVYERRITGIVIRNIVGFIHVYHEKDATNEFNEEDNF